MTIHFFRDADGDLEARGLPRALRDFLIADVQESIPSATELIDDLARMTELSPEDEEVLSFNETTLVVTPSLARLIGIDDSECHVSTSELLLLVQEWRTAIGET